MESVSSPKKPYQIPQLKQHQLWVIQTGVSLPIGTTGLEPMNDFMDGEQ